ISSLKPEDTKDLVRRIESSLEEASKLNENIKRIEYNDRNGLVFSKKWAQEIIFGITSNGDLKLSIFPGNTKAQGLILFEKEPEFYESLKIENIEYPVEKKFYIAFTSYQKYFASISFTEKYLKKNLYTKENFSKFTGRKKRGEQWKALEQLFKSSFNNDFDWQTECGWEGINKSGKNQFDISFGFYISITIPFKKLQELDQVHDNLNNLVNLTEYIFEAFNNELLIE
ncbi:hypothetical protein, partial [Psychrobacter sp. DAB_AL32B]|uniref:hypothetical protein n=1 Tax=Psychrobacter sp. DAB_AL32B TaxID=1028414 RepID=UPI000B9D3CB5